MHCNTVNFFQTHILSFKPREHCLVLAMSVHYAYFCTLIKIVRRNRKWSSCCFLSPKAERTSRPTSNSRVSLKSSAHRRGVRSITLRTTVSKNKLLYLEALSHDLTDKRGEWQSPPLPSPTEYNCVRGGLYNREFKDLEVQALLKRPIMNECINNYITRIIIKM